MNRTYLVVILTILVVFSYSFHYFLNNSHYRRFLGLTSIFFFHPLLIVTTILAIFNLINILKKELQKKYRILLFLNVIIILFFVYYTLKIIYSNFR